MRWTTRVAVCALLSCGLPNVSVSAPYTLATSVSGVVNGQPVSAAGSGMGDSATGIYTIDWSFAAVPSGYSIWGTIVTKGGSGGSGLGKEVAAAQNIISMNGGNYDIHEVATFPGGDTIVANVAIRTVGSAITINSTLSGNVDLPDLVGIAAPAMLWTPGPGPNQFVETVTKQLIRQDGGPSIPVDTVATYTLVGGGSLSQPQFRDLSMEVLSIMPDPAHPLTATIEYTSIVRPIPEPSTALILAALTMGIFCVFRRQLAK